MNGIIFYTFICTVYVSVLMWLVMQIMKYLDAVNEVKHTQDEQVAARLIEEHHLTQEQVPTILYMSKEVGYDFSV